MANFLQRVVGGLGRFLVRASGTLRDPALTSLFGGAPNEAGVAVNEQSALSFSPVWAAVNQIATGCAQLPCHLYQNGESWRTLATGHPVYRLLHVRANPEMSSLDFRQALFHWALTWGNGFAEIQRDPITREVLALWPLRPDWSKLFRHDDGTLWVIYQDPHQEVARIPYDDVFHLKGLSFDGLCGYSPIQLLRVCIGLGIAAERYGAKFFGQGARPSGVLTHPQQLSDKARKALKEEFELLHSGLSNAHRVAVLEEGVKWESIAIPPEEAQFIETRKFSVLEVARVFNLPPHKLRDMNGSGYNSLESENRAFLSETLLPWLQRFEQEANWKLFNGFERGRYFVRHNVEGLLRADQAQRFASYALGRNWGFYSVNEIREMEDLPPIKGGDVYLQPLNMQPFGMTPGANAPAGNPALGLAPGWMPPGWGPGDPNQGAGPAKG